MGRFLPLIAIRASANKLKVQIFRISCRVRISLNSCFFSEAGWYLALPMKLSGPLVLIDDDADDMTLLLDVLKRMGLDGPIRSFDDCFSAMEYLKSTDESPFLIICDVNLPVMNGLEFRREINANEYLRKKSIPFIFLSTAAMKNQVLEAYDLTVQGYFVKPYSIADMQNVLTSILNYWQHCVHPNTVK